MTLERWMRLIAGSFILLSLILSQLVSPYWLLLTGFVGANMFQVAFTGFRPADIVFRKLGLKEGPAFTYPATGITKACFARFDPCPVRQDSRTKPTGITAAIAIDWRWRALCRVVNRRLKSARSGGE